VKVDLEKRNALKRESREQEVESNGRVVDSRRSRLASPLCTQDLLGTPDSLIHAVSQSEAGRVVTLHGRMKKRGRVVGLGLIDLDMSGQMNPRGGAQMAGSAFGM
jgi:hypothetical protein